MPRKLKMLSTAFVRTAVRRTPHSHVRTSLSNFRFRNHSENRDESDLVGRGEQGKETGDQFKETKNQSIGRIIDENVSRVFESFQNL